MALLPALARAGARRPLPYLVGALLLLGGLVAWALRLETKAAVGSFLGGEGQTASATKAVARAFGSEPLVVEVKGPLSRLLLADDLTRLYELERCLAGELAQAKGACAALAKGRYVKLILGPGTFIAATAQRFDAALATLLRKASRVAAAAGQAVERKALEAGEGAARAKQLAGEARQATLQAYAKEAASLALQEGVVGEPSLSNQTFVLPLVLQDHGRSEAPKRRFSFLFPTPQLALVSVRLSGELSEGARGRAVGLVEAALQEPRFALAGATYGLTGEPALVSQFEGRLGGQLAALVGVSILVSALLLGLIFPGRPRLLPLFVALLAAFFAIVLVGASEGGISLGVLAVAPALIGLGVDYGVQVHLETERAARRRRLGGAPLLMARRFGPTIKASALGSGASLLALLLLGLPLLRSFAALLLLGIASGLCFAFLFGSASFVAWRGRFKAGVSLRPFGDAWRGARELLAALPLGTVGQAGRALGLRRPVIGLALAAVAAALGLALSVRGGVETDLGRLLPANLPALRALRALEREASVGGQLTLLVEGKNLYAARALAWLAAYERRIGRAFDTAGCPRRLLCPTFSLGGLTRGREGRAVRTLLAEVPPLLRNELLSPNHRFALLSFSQRTQSVARERSLIGTLLSLAHPPAGIKVEPAGLFAVVAQEGASLAQPTSRLLTLLLAALLGAAVGGTALGGRRAALFLFAFALLAAGWSGLLLVLTGLGTNPLSLSLSAVAVALSVQFGALLWARYTALLGAGRSPAGALAVAYRTTGRAVFCSAATVLAAFAVLSLSPIPLLSQFGLATVVELGGVALAVFVGLPSLLVRFGQPRALRRSAPLRPR